MSIAIELRTLYHLALGRVRGETHAERLESFYRGQAADYDAFRRRLLHGREELYTALEAPHDGVWIDFGGGTGSNFELLGSSLGHLRRAYIVDLAPSLLDVARARIARLGWNNVTAIEADATTFVPAEGAADVVTFSYALTMIPDWFAAIDRALSLLRPGGTIGVVDFYVNRRHAAVGVQHGWWTRTFWPTWFALDGVYLSADHVPYLQRRFETLRLAECHARVPYVPAGRVPYYFFIGRKPEP